MDAAMKNVDQAIADTAAMIVFKRCIICMQVFVVCIGEDQKANAGENTRKERREMLCCNAGRCVSSDFTSGAMQF
jgi:hypothetical protein